jgi:hypothetical protein
MQRIAIYLLILISAVGASAQERPCSTANNEAKTDGGCWRALSHDARSFVIRGFWAGAQARSIADGLIGNQASYGFARDWLDTPPQTVVNDIVEYFDQLYESPANRQISWHNAYILAALKARDDDSDDRIALIQVLREAKGIPTQAKLLKVKSPTLLTMQAGTYVFDLRLSYVSADGLTPPQRSQAIRFLEGFRRVVLGTCRYGTELSLQIRYVPEFIKQKTLSGEVVVPSYGTLCFDNSEIALTSFLQENQSLSGLMLTRGLVRADLGADEKWSEHVRRITGLWGSAVSIAAEKGLYIHGPNNDPFVDAVLARGWSTSAKQP